MKAIVGVCFVGALMAWGGQPAAAQGTSQELIQQARAANASRYQFAVDHGAQILPTADQRSFYVFWRPPETSSSRRPIIVTLHGHGSWALDEFFLWQPYAERYGYTIFALQWWFGGGEAVEDYYAPQQMYPLIEDVLDQHGIRPGTALLHGFSRGSANVYALTALDQQTGHHFFRLTVANAGAAAEDFPPNRDITKGVFGQAVFLGTHWVLFCGGYDEHPDRDGCPAMRRTQAWLARLDGMVEDLIEDDAAGHGGFHQHQANVTRALDVFDRLLGSSGSSSARQVQ